MMAEWGSIRRAGSFARAKLSSGETHFDLTGSTGSWPGPRIRWSQPSPAKQGEWEYRDAVGCVLILYLDVLSIENTLEDR